MKKQIISVILLFAIALSCFTGCSSWNQTNTYQGETLDEQDVYVIHDGTTMILTTTPGLFRPHISRVQDEEWRNEITKVIIRDNIKTWDIDYWFRDMPNLVTIEGLEKLDTSQVPFFTQMFSGCKSLRNISGISQWDTSAAEYMSEMFYGCQSLTTLDLSGWDVSHVNDMYSMFAYSGLVEIKGMDNWNTASLHSVTSMFKDCKNLKNIGNLENWDMSYVGSMQSMFEGCESLEDIGDLNKWNLPEDINDFHTFYGCSSLRRLPAWAY